MPLQKNKTTKHLYVGTVNGESSLYSKKAKTYIHAKDATRAVIGLFKRYMKLYGKAVISDLHKIDKSTKQLSRVSFNQQECLKRIFKN